MAEPDIAVTDNPAKSRYEIHVDGDLAGFALYRDHQGVRTFVHTVIDDDYEGHGLGGKLARAALDDVRSRGLTVIARCPFVSGYIDRHPEYRELLAPK